MRACAPLRAPRAGGGGGLRARDWRVVGRSKPMLSVAGVIRVAPPSRACARLAGGGQVDVGRRVFEQVVGRDLAPAVRAYVRA